MSVYEEYFTMVVMDDYFFIRVLKVMLKYNLADFELCSWCSGQPNYGNLLTSPAETRLVAGSGQRYWLSLVDDQSAHPETT